LIGFTQAVLIEILQTTVVDNKTNERIDGIVGNNFSSYVRDYDFSVVCRSTCKAIPAQPRRKVSPPASPHCARWSRASRWA
jgi:hypothetical protein